MPRRHREEFTSDSELADSNDDPFERQSDADFDYTTRESGSDNEVPSLEPADQSNDEKSEREEEED